MSYLKSRFFKTSNGNEYEVIRTEYGNSKEVLSAVDTIRNSKGITKKMTRKKTLEFIKS